MKDIFENYEIKIARKSIDDVISNTSTSNETTLLDLKMTNEEFKNSYSLNMMWTITILMSFVIWIVCIVSLVLNIVRKNIGKAIFSGVGILVPIIACIVSSTGRTMAFSGLSIGNVLVFIALLTQVITLIVSFIFCFSKKK